MTARTRNRALWMKSEATYSVDADPDGDTYIAVPCLALGMLQNQQEVL
jgi:hypothetical protein